MNEQLSHKFCIFLEIHVSNVFSMIVSMCEIYELWMNEFFTISIIKSSNDKFVMFLFVFYVQSPKLLKLQMHVTFFSICCVFQPPLLLISYVHNRKLPKLSSKHNIFLFIFYM